MAFKKPTTVSLILVLAGIGCLACGIVLIARAPATSEHEAHGPAAAALPAGAPPPGAGVDGAHLAPGPRAGGDRGSGYRDYNDRPGAATNSWDILMHGWTSGGDEFGENKGGDGGPLWALSDNLARVLGTCVDHDLTAGDNFYTTMRGLDLLQRDLSKYQGQLDSINAQLKALDVPVVFEGTKTCGPNAKGFDPSGIPEQQPGLTPTSSNFVDVPEWWSIGTPTDWDGTRACVGDTSTRMGCEPVNFSQNTLFPDRARCVGTGSSFPPSAPPVS